MSNSRKKIIVCLCLALMTGAVFGVAVTYDFLNYDDKAYVTRNHRVQSGLSIEGVVWAFTTTLQGHWHPLTLLSHMLDCQLFGLNPAGHHATSILFHILNTILLFILLERMTKAPWPSAFVAALFAIHPLHVESVAWIAARKDVLSTFFMLLMLRVYVSYTEHPGIGKYLLALGLFTAGLLSKSMLVTIPFVMLLLDYWPLGRLTLTVSGQERGSSLSSLWKSQILWEKAPFMLVSILVSTVTLLARQERLSDTTRSLLPFVEGLIHAVNGYAQYIWKVLLPTNLSVEYQQNVPVFNWETLTSLALLIGITLLCFSGIRKRPYLAVGWLWFLGMLAPVSGIIKTGPQILADRYTYTPLIGLFMMLSWGILEVSGKRLRVKRVATVVMVLILATFSILSLKQIRYWENSITLFSNAVIINPNSTGSLINLGLALQEIGNDNEAMECLNRAVQLDPENKMTQCGLGYILFEMGQYQEAIDCFSHAIRIDPTHVEAHMQLGACLTQTGDFDRAREYYIEAIRLDPDNPKTYHNYGVALAQERKDGEALDQIKKALDIEPNFGLALKRLSIFLEQGIKLYKDGKLQEAEELLEKMARRFPEEPNVYLYLGHIASDKGEPDSAISHLLNAIEAGPEYTEAHVNLGIEFARKKSFAQAEKAFSDALRIEPNHVKAHYNYAVSLYLEHRYREAMEQLTKTLEIDPDHKKSRNMLDALRVQNNE